MNGVERWPAGRAIPRESESVREPPPYLLGAALISWSWIIDWMWLGIVLALAVESHRRVSWRWDFSDEDYVRIWNVCVALFLCVGVFQALDGRFLGMARAFQKWLPVLLLPMQLAQIYGTQRTVSLVTFSMVARRKRELDLKLGRDPRPPLRFHFGHVYLAATIMALGVERSDGYTVFLLASALILWALWPLATPGKGRLAWIAAAGMTLVLGHAGQRTWESVQRDVEHWATEWFQRNRPGSHEMAVTEIGEVGEIKLSPNIVWRVRVATGAPPRYLRENVYRRYRVVAGAATWSNGRDPRMIMQEVPLRNARDGSDWEWAPIPEGREASAATLRGRLKRVILPLPVPRETTRFVDLTAAELRRSPLGVFVVTTDPGSLDFLAVYDGDVAKARDEPPLSTAAARSDLETPESELPGLNRVLESLGINEGDPARAIVMRLRQWFASEEFRYTRHLEGRNGVEGMRDTLITQFLEENRAGHCEYFASATVLLLRAAGVPARYAVGFAVREYDSQREEFVVRGLHAHSWAMAWVDGAWEEVDTTPASWETEERAELSRWQGLRDMLSRWRVDFDLWRQSEEKGIVWSLIPLGIAGVLMGLVLVRFLRGFRRSGRRTPSGPASSAWERIGLDSEWYEAERALASVVPGRREGQPLRSWYEGTRILLEDLGPRVERALDLHYRLRFDPKGLDPEERGELAELARVIGEEALRRPALSER
ncbi:MAG TPA: transglutaminase-like domain-containing protein [Verrucomicrobiales bacterium]|nr:transglutaminase-like domain-containing protein [Verrucomicrobiales bacterium]